MLIFPSLFCEYIYYFLFSLFVVIEIGNTLKTGSNNTIQKKNPNIFLALALFIMISILGVSIYNGIGFLPKEWQFISYFGVTLLVIGISFRQYSIYILGQYFTSIIQIQHHHCLIKEGPYRYFRHPSYFGAVISFTGIALGINNYLCLICFLIIACVVYTHRTSIEEDVLLKTFGNEYEEYKKRTWGFLPFIR